MNNFFKSIFLCGIFLLNSLETPFGSVVSTGNFSKDFFVTSSPSHVTTSKDGRSRSLMMDKASGSAFASKDMFLFGQFDMKIKMVPDYSAGTVLAFYLTSDQPKHDELDFEFLGNVSGQPYIIQTNVFTDGFGNREERTYLWFDPTKDFHTYSVMWNIHQIVFMVDSVPIRTYIDHADKKVAYPRFQPMSIKVSLWDGSSWATRGGKDKVDYSKGPFIASMANYTIDACIWTGDARPCRKHNSVNWWNNREFSSLNPNQKRLLKWVRKNYLLYDYCQDNKRFKNNLPKECSLT